MMKEIVHKCKTERHKFNEYITISSDDNGKSFWLEEPDGYESNYLIQINYCPFCGDELKHS